MPADAEDVVRRLGQHTPHAQRRDQSLMMEAAALIERQSAEIATLRAQVAALEARLAS